MKKIKLLIYLLIILIVCSCTPLKYIEVPVETIKNNYIINEKHDTLIIRDSVDRWLKNDTVFITKFKYVYKTIYEKDTIFKTDTITKTVYKDKLVTINELKTYQKFLIYMGVFFIFLIIFVFYKKFKL